MRRTPILLATAAATALLLASCGSDDEPTASSSSATPEATQPADDGAASAEAITDVVAGNPEFSTLLAAVTAAGLGDTLSGEGPFTVFAPTNAAFAELPPKTLTALLKPANRDQLTAILTYHVVPAEVMAADVEAGQVATVNGAPFAIELDRLRAPAGGIGTVRT
jgi:uncharacterized surface protein with fasciclin (FAS1) repeats